ncbi:branched-chain amino acid ABC transporter permease [Chitinimonas sp.]|uniref:branched-chain amino acid ABC transporter permease n=1 Tax=Chitinimonas sp. TaxID=1934313 RepID=UPI002F923CDF
MIIAQMSVSGAAMGMAYALIAYGFQLTYAPSRSLNFGQAEAVMISAFVALSLIGTGMPYGLALLLTLGFGALLGLAVERFGVRLALQQKNEGWILLTIILGLFGSSVAENIWGRDDKPLPTPIPTDPIALGSISVTWFEVSIVVGALVLMAGIELFRRKTLMGKAVDAVAADPGVAELMGIHSQRAVALAYGLSGATAAFAGILIAPITTVGPTMAAGLILKSFSVAVVAGLESGFGVIVAGVVLGALESLSSIYLGSGWREAPGIVLLIAVLALRPNGLFGKATIRKV